MPGTGPDTADSCSPQPDLLEHGVTATLRKRLRDTRGNEKAASPAQHQETTRESSMEERGDRSRTTENGRSLTGDDLQSKWILLQIKKERLAEWIKKQADTTTHCPFTTLQHYSKNDIKIFNNR